MKVAEQASDTSCLAAGKYAAGYHLCRRMWFPQLFTHYAIVRPTFAPGQVWVPRLGNGRPRLIEAPAQMQPWRRAWRWRRLRSDQQAEVWSERRLRAWARRHRAVCVPAEETE